MQIPKTSDWSAANQAQAGQLAAGQAQSDAMKWMLPALALGGTAGALRGLYNSYQKRKKVDQIQGDLVSEPTPVPLGMGKSASLTPKSAGLGDFLAGNNATSYGAAAVPWAIPGAIAALYGGYQLGKKPIEAIANSNMQSDLTDDLQKSKRKYLQSVRQPTDAAVLDSAMNKAAAAPFFSMEKWGPELGVGTGVLGGLSLLSALHGYHKSKNKLQQEEDAKKQQAFSEEVKTLQPTPAARLPQPVVFS